MPVNRGFINRQLHRSPTGSSYCESFTANGENLKWALEMELTAWSIPAFSEKSSDTE